MDREVAQMVVMSTLRACVELGDLRPLLKTHGDDAKDEAVKHAIASAIFEIGVVADRVFDQYPDLKTAVEDRLNEYGRSYY
jgi:hypothetical protein